MPKITMTIEELLNLVKGELPTEEMKKNLANALFDSWVNNPEMQARIDEKAEELALEKVRRLIRDAFNVEKPAYWNNNKVTFSGWGAQIVENEIELALKEFGGERKMTLQRLINEALDAVRKSYAEAWDRNIDSINPRVDALVREAIPKYVTEEYRERVAAHFDDKKLADMVQEIAKNAIGGMIMSGALSFSPPKVGGGTANFRSGGNGQ